MDEFISEFQSVRDGDLVLCEHDGVAYQADMSHRAPVPYFDVYNGYDGAEERRIAEEIHRGRVWFVDHFVGGDFPVLDVGIGNGQFLRHRPNTFGFDVEEKAVTWLKSVGKWSDDFRRFRAFTFWDVIEHLERPEDYFKHMLPGSRLFTCLPIFDDLSCIRASRHYRPGEHLLYFTDEGLISWMALHRFSLIGRSSLETDAGRDSIMTFAFERFPE